MAAQRKWIQAATVAIDEDTAELVIDLGHHLIRGEVVTVNTTAVRLQTLVPGDAFDAKVKLIEIQNCDGYTDMGWAVAKSQPSSIEEMGLIPPGLILPIEGTALELADVWIIGGTASHRVYVLERGG